MEVLNFRFIIKFYFLHFKNSIIRFLQEPLILQSFWTRIYWLILWNYLVIKRESLFYIRSLEGMALFWVFFLRGNSPLNLLRKGGFLIFHMFKAIIVVLISLYLSFSRILSVLQLPLLTCWSLRWYVFFFACTNFQSETMLRFLGI